VGSRHDALVNPAGRLPQAAPRVARVRAQDTITWLVALAAGLTLLKLLLYIAAAQPFGGAEQALCEWDCQWYRHTIQNGYDPEPRLVTEHDFTNWAFFPLFPLLARALKFVTGLSAFWAGTAVSVLCFIGFAAVSLRYRELTRGPVVRQTSWIVLLIVFPFSFYFLAVYSESTYLFVTALLLLAVRTDRPTGAGVATALLTATRPTGVLAIPYLAVERLWHARLAFRPGLDFATRMRILADSAFPLALAPLGIALYMAYLYWLTGDALAFSHIQLAWEREFVNPLKSFYWGVMKADWGALLDPHSPQSQIYGAMFVPIAGITCLWLLWRRLFLETWLLGATVLLALTTGVLSMPRFVLTNPVFLLALGDGVDRISSRTVRISLAAVAVLLQAYVLYLWFLESSALM